ncbi:DNA polymerase III subunit delta [Helicobacter saguini]|uniref:DNA polymerase III subunit delta n=1 Tax=Helicobacter saguini TaxID=1548018 RepID=A0A347VGT9_9HELI|nr:DNA polymerase III subunit delta' [Helicobacter saguini]MWV62027.1 DNA polymerase III subunit delta [Helicobacter saguini]MWV67299.1 DNA polymerase III subunit delta [Helicobacter saguini]MWV69652.1 DNA polymerase III subunit delta [Helicobacter saguini]MWV73131.1 DNA polymerase III subunit delta [Helicobacter saguini]TLD95506.1 DNA polymerase III subunit delta [Helicobacter saguini]
MLDSNFTDNYQKSHIIITNDFNGELNLLQNTKDINTLRIFGVDFNKNEFTNELKINDAHDIINEAYITTSTKKIIAIFAYSYNIISQNALLKVLEEPPKNVSFILYINGRNKLIPTIFSRLAHFDRRNLESIEAFPLDITKLSIPVVYNYIRDIEVQNLNSENGHKILTSLLHAIASKNINLNRRDLERFDKAIKSLKAKQSVHLVLLPILLSLIRQ